MTTYIARLVPLDELEAFLNEHFGGPTGQNVSRYLITKDFTPDKDGKVFVFGYVQVYAPVPPYEDAEEYF